MKKKTRTSKPIDEWNAQLGINIAEAREEAQMSQALLAGHCNAAISEIKTYEDGRRIPTLKRMSVIATVLSVYMDDLTPPVLP